VLFSFDLKFLKHMQVRSNFVHLAV
jgi:hypothetical protein